MCKSNSTESLVWFCYDFPVAFYVLGLAIHQSFSRTEGKWSSPHTSHFGFTPVNLSLGFLVKIALSDHPEQTEGLGKIHEC